MSKSRQARRQQRRNRRQQSRQGRAAATRRGGVNWQAWGWGGAAALAVAGVIALVVLAGGGGSEGPDPLIEAQARSINGGSDIRVYQGTQHTIYHSTAPLPTASAPRTDGLPTLVWFTWTGCPFCRQMEPFIYDVAEQFSARMIFVEKSVNNDGGASRRYGVIGTPTFVLLDETGGVIGRFSYQSSATALAVTIDTVLTSGGSLGGRTTPIGG